MFENTQESQRFFGSRPVVADGFRKNGVGQGLDDFVQPPGFFVIATLDCAHHLKLLAHGDRPEAQQGPLRAQQE